MLIADVIAYLEGIAPPALAEDYDNPGLQCGSADVECRGVMLTLDCLPDALQEAVDTGCNLVVAHHPLIFKGLKRIDPGHWVGQALELAIRHRIAIYALHTNLDNAMPGVNTMLADRLGLEPASLVPLAPMKGQLSKLVTYAPLQAADAVLRALHLAGAGQIGHYADCSFVSLGEGRYTPGAGTNPAIGAPGVPERAPETRIEVVLPRHLEGRVLAALRQAHPYEEVAYQFIALSNTWQDVGAGAIGRLPKPMPTEDFLLMVCQNLGLEAIKHTNLVKTTVRRVALCGGAGSFLLGAARKAGADIFVTGDMKHHELLEAGPGMIVADVGHYESEYLICQWLGERLSQKFSNFAVRLSERVRSPTRFFIP